MKWADGRVARRPFPACAGSIFAGAILADSVARESAHLALVAEELN